MQLMIYNPDSVSQHNLLGLQPHPEHFLPEDPLDVGICPTLCYRDGHSLGKTTQEHGCEGWSYEYGISELCLVCWRCPCHGQTGF